MSDTKTSEFNEVIDANIPQFVVNVESPQDVNLMNEKLFIIDTKIETLRDWLISTSLVNVNNDEKSLRRISGSTHQSIYDLKESGEYLLQGGQSFNDLPVFEGNAVGSDKLISIRIKDGNADLFYAKVTVFNTGDEYILYNGNLSSRTGTWVDFDGFLERVTGAFGKELISSETVQDARSELGLGSAALLNHAGPNATASSNQLVRGDDKKLNDALSKKQQMGVGDGLKSLTSGIGIGENQRIGVDYTKVVSTGRVGAPEVNGIKGIAPLDTNGKVPLDFLPEAEQVNLNGLMRYVADLDLSNGKIVGNSGIALNTNPSNAPTTQMPSGGFLLCVGNLTSSAPSWIRNLNLKTGDILVKQVNKWIPIRNTIVVNSINTSVTQHNSIPTEKAVLDFVNSKMNQLGSAATRNVVAGSGDVLLKNSSAAYNGTIDQLHNSRTGDINNFVGNRDLASFSISGNSSIFNIIRSTRENNRDVALQCCHPVREHSSTGKLHLNPLGGDVLVNKSTVLHTGNIRKTTGNDDSFPMTQKAVTDALNTKANSSHKHSVNDITGVLPISKGGTGSNSASGARSSLGLGTAATHNVGEETGQVIRVGNSGGLLSRGARYSPSRKSNLFFYDPNNIPSDYPLSYKFGSGISLNHGYSGNSAEVVISHETGSRMAFRGSQSMPWREVLHTGNIYSKIGTSGTDYLQSENGFIKLPNGIIIQWGRKNLGDLGNRGSSSVEGVTFPIAFPNHCRSFVAQGVRTSGTSNLSRMGLLAVDISKTKVDKFLWDDGGIGRTQNINVYWIAIGY